ncbi:LURP-one-related/scramblase family protein [Companilactobacillus mishanensis]|uniref:Uncharacterized protein n=1 Tax=Companilactobacillus mishanensis TaxID=2486008 RepID=A0ABW9P7U8_9LACO|nr:hypothetical protein [Companilactobacillus mishanensis]MQS45348.1 hypothetical protein [Companilactobacillus mishanensis]MQS88941.1 hypothetical protein [Companilactobacillus mishanensis]
MNLYIRKADLISGSIMVVSNQNKETVFIASRDKNDPFQIQLFNRLNQKIAEIKLKNSFLRIFSIEKEGKEIATINAIPMLDVKYVHLGIINWNIVGNLPLSEYHVKKNREVIMEVTPTILSLGNQGLQLKIKNIEDLEVGTLIAIFLDKYIKMPGLQPDDKLTELQSKSKLSFLNFKINKKC